MCAVIGAVIRHPSKDDFDTLNRVFHESKIRGMHATGLSYIKSGKVITVKHPVPADQFPFNFEEYVNDDILYLIGHCRYSTSDLEYNQPLATDTKSIVHNGVISQELPENWEKLYGYSCMTKNDSELVLHSDNPLQEFSHMSMGVCELNANKTLRVYRNGKRPLYLTSIENGSIITSTADIAKRANVNGTCAEILMNTYLTFDENLAMVVQVEPVPDSKDFQPHEIR
jgi:glutamine phosphoribosylpyrophosphate amidotransferase